MKKSNDSWSVDEIYVKVRGKWMYLDQVIDSSSQTLDFLLNQTRSKRAANRFFRKVLDQSPVTTPRMIPADKNAAYPPAIDDLKEEIGLTPKQSVYLEDYDHIQSVDQALALQLSLEQGKVKAGDAIVLVGAGTGYTWRAISAHWG